jgi:hypothetical protein
MKNSARLAVIDRVNATWEGVMGTTFACVQCHSHPYDPFRHEEYYKFMAFFNNTRDEDTFEDYPLLRHHNSGDSVKLLHIVDWLQKNGFRQDALSVERFIKTWQPARVFHPHRFVYQQRTERYQMAGHA